MTSTNLIPINDINYLAQQSSGKINMILSGMTSIMNDTNSKVEKMENQDWFQRMIKTVFGKNKATKEEIKQNHDKLNVYMSEAISELYNRNCIDQQVMISLGTQLNELYSNHLQLKQILGAFVTRLNEKIESVDNFHMLINEINQGMYSNDRNIITICEILSQFDNRIMEEERKLNLIKVSLENQKIITEDEFLLKDYLMDIMNISVDRIGKIYLELSTIRNDFFSNLILEIIENYHFLPDLRRKMTKKDVLINNLIEKEGLDDTVMLSINEIYDNFINSKIEAKSKLIQVNSVKNNNQYLNVDNTDSNNLGTDSDVEKNDYNLDDADNFFENKEYSKSFEVYEKFALEGNAYAQFQTALSYSEGYGVTANQEKAFEWLIKSANQDFTSAQNVMGYLYSEGSEEMNIEVDYEKAFEWHMKTAQKEDSLGEYSIGIFYLEGFGVEQNFKEAYRWFKKSLNHGYEEAEEMLEELSERVSKKTLKKIEERCSDFVWNNYDKFDYNDYKVVLEFNLNDENVYLTHDDTLFKNGKNGFAITNRGIYCRGMFQSYNSFTSYKELSKVSFFYTSNGEIFSNTGDKVAYITGSKEEKWNLEKLFSDIRDYLKDEEFIE